MEAIAIIGMAGRFPGASDVDGFWRNQLEGRESIARFTAEELRAELRAEPGAESTDLSREPNFVPARSVLEGVELFDAAFFGMLPKEAEQTDPQHRLLLECAWEALEGAGYDPAGYPGSIGVFAGASYPSYFLSRLCAQPGFRESFSQGYQIANYREMVGNQGDFLATRVAYKLDLRGPAFTLAAGCSTSLIAVCQAAQSLLAGESDMALAGGASVTLPQKRGYLYQPGGMGSADGHCRTFDAEAAGTVFGSGVGMVLLKRLADAERDGDTVHAVIRGWALNNDGAAKIGYTAPSVEGQARVIAEAQRRAGVGPESIGYIEAHGTSTPLGDPIELAALGRVFNAGLSAERGLGEKHCVLGAVKTNVGHLDVASGITGLIHAVHVVREAVLPKTLHFTTPTPRFDWAANPFRVATERTSWMNADGNPRRAGVSSFGVGGTNVHVVLEQAPPPDAQYPAREERAQLLVLSARSASALEAMRGRLAAHLRAHPATNLADLAWTLEVGRRAFPHRVALVATSVEEAVRQLSSADAGSRAIAPSEASALTMLFAGQGAQQPGMGQGLYAAEPVFRRAVDEAAAILEPKLGLNLRTVIYPETRSPEADRRLMETSLAQPALFVTQYALARLWAARGICPAAMLGHSVGEYVAATLAGVFSLEDALELIAVRGRLMQALPGGVMLSVRLSEQELLPLLEEASLAAVNAPKLCVASGPEDAIAGLETRLAARKIAHKRLYTSHAFHSAMMDPILAPFAQAVGARRLAAPTIPFVSSVTGDWITDAEATDPAYWARQVREPVRFADALGRLAGPRVLLETGPGATLTTLARQQGCAEWTLISSLGASAGESSECGAINRALGELWLAGLRPDWAGCHAGERRMRIPLPTYPFERKRYWVDLPTESAERSGIPVAQLAEDETMPGLAPPSERGPVQVFPVTAATESHEAEPARDGTGPEESFLAARGEQGSARPARLEAELREMVEELSGLEIAPGETRASFLELGLDSLLLTQVVQQMEKRWKVRITFRELMGELDSIAAVAAHLDRTLAEEATPALAVGETTKATGAATHSVSGAAAMSSLAAAPVLTAQDQHPVQQLFLQQTQAMQQLFAQQLAALGSGSAIQAASLTTPPASAATSPATSPAKPAAALPDKELAVSARLQGRRATLDTPLTPGQQASLDALIDRYSRRTAGSKRVTQQQREVLADPRVASGFRAQWKEMVYPIITVRSEGAHLWDVDGNRYVDILNGYGPILLGHRPKYVQRAIEDQLRLGFETGPQTLLAGEVARQIARMTGSERVTFCNTGSEAVTAALRLARTVTGRDRVVIFAGDYHGMFDEVLVKGVWKGGVPRALPASPGIPRAKCENIVVLEYGTDESLAWIREHASELAAVMVEPVQSRHPALVPIEFLREVRRITEASETCLIFDEVVTGFRVHPGGCQALWGIRADLATYGKVLAGGMPMGVVAGRARFMDALDGGMWQYGDDSRPEVGVTFFAGTFVRHPLAMAAAKAVLEHLEAEGPALQEGLAATTAALAGSLNRLFQQNGVAAKVDHFSSFFYLSFAPEVRFAGLFYYWLREKGIHLQEGFPCFLTTAHREAEIAWILGAFTETIAEMQAGELLDPKPEAPAPVRFPLTESQREVWLASQHGELAALAFNESFTLRLGGPLDPARLGAALGEVLARQECLRAKVLPGGLEFEVAPTLEVALPLVDLSALDEPSAGERLAALKQVEARGRFDLEAGPLLRAQLVRFSAEDHALVITAHHLVMDGWSVNVLLSELGALYAGETLPAAPSFAAFARAQAAALGSQPGADAEAYWTSRFAEPASPLDLPVDRARPAIKSYAGATYRTHWAPETARLVRGAGASEGCTLFVTLLAGFTALLSRLSGQSDIVVGIPTAAQSLVDESALIGHAVNLLPIRTQVERDDPFAALLKRMQKTLLDAYDHQDYTYGTLVRALKLKKDVSRLPLIEVEFNLEKLGRGLRFGGLKAEAEANAKAAVNFDLFLNIGESPAGLTLDLDYNTCLFDEATVARWLDHYRTLLTEAAGDRTQPVGALALLDPQSRQALVAQGAGPADARGPERAAHRLFASEAVRRPRATAVSTASESASYAELDHGAEQIAAFLESLGIRPGDLVGIATERGLPMVEALLGIWKAGAAYVPLDPAYPRARLDMILAETCVPVLVTDSRNAEKFRDTPTHLVVLDRDRAQIAEARRENPELAPVRSSQAAIEADALEQVELDRLAYVIFTSGSTGRPKGVEVTHRNLANLLMAMQQAPGIAVEDRLLAVTTLSFDIAALELYLPLITGAEVYVAGRETASDARLLGRLLNEERFTLMQATPATWRMLVETGWRPRPDLRMLCGGEALPRTLADALLAGAESGNESGAETVELWNMYGPTETTVWSAAGRVQPGAGAILLGEPILNTQLYVVAPQDPSQLQPIGVPGELVIGGTGVARGYYRRADLTRERFVPDTFSATFSGSPVARIYRTGDLVRRTPSGAIEFLGRLDHQVKVNGFRMELGEIEAALARQPGVGASVVMARADDPERPSEKRLVAYLAAAPGAIPPTSSGLRQALRGLLPEFMVPTLYVILPELPRTPNGKIDRAQLPAPDARNLQRRAFAAAASPMEQRLERMAAEVLKLEAVDVTESLFALGADSIHLFQFLARARAAGLGLELPQVLRLQTVRAIAAWLGEQGGSGPGGASAIQPVARERYRAVPAGQPAPAIAEPEALEKGVRGGAA